jgi:hypothetical protein
MKSNIRITYEGINAIVSNCHKLTNLSVYIDNISHHSKLPSCIDIIAAKNIKLTVLALAFSNSSKESNTDKNLTLFDFYMTPLSTNCHMHMLSELTLRGTKYLSDNVFISILLGCQKSLIKLVLHDCARMTDHTVLVLSMHCKKLKNCTLLRCHKLADESLFAIATYLPEISSLFVSNCVLMTDIGFYKLMENCTELSLDI